MRDMHTERVSLSTGDICICRCTCTCTYLHASPRVTTSMPALRAQSTQVKLHRLVQACNRCLWIHTARLARPNKDASAVASTRQNTAPDTFNLHATNTSMYCRMFPQRDPVHIQSPLHITYNRILSSVGLKASQPPKNKAKTKCNSTVGHSSNTVGSLNGVCPELLRTKARSGRASLRSNLWNKGEEIPVLGEPEAAAVGRV
ncbi:hypothetical protein J3E69DRAFT_264878 [Trichoderma sp. SZMC 28015]